MVVNDGVVPGPANADARNRTAVNSVAKAFLRNIVLS
jgi:hypothetical protein